MNQDTLVLIKPDCIRRKLVGQVVIAIETLGLHFQHLELRKLLQSQAMELYKEHKTKWHFTRNIRHMTSGPVVVIHVKGEDAVKKCRLMVESFRTANQDVIKLPRNLVHATDDPDKVTHELLAVGCNVDD